MQRGLDELWKFTGEFFVPAAYEVGLINSGVGVDLETVRAPWGEKVGEVLAEAGLAPVAVWMQTGGKEGRHTEHLGYLLAEMQFLQRAYPDCEW
jgi:ring-1,2-phenylacetyl-CoA epoxidase subunit PaaC